MQCLYVGVQCDGRSEAVPGEQGLRGRCCSNALSMGGGRAPSSDMGWELTSVLCLFLVFMWVQSDMPSGSGRRESSSL